MTEDTADVGVATSAEVAAAGVAAADGTRAGEVIGAASATTAGRTGGTTTRMT